MAGRPKGLPKTGGKPKGYSDEATKGARELFKQIIEGEFHYIQESMAAARKKDPIKYLDVLSRFTSFVLPKQVEATITDNSIKVKTSDE